MDLKPRTDWKKDCSITRGRGSGGQIRWKGPGSLSGSDRFLVIVERNKGKPNAFRRSELVEGTPDDAAARMQKLIEEADAAVNAQEAPPAPATQASSSASRPAPEALPVASSIVTGAVSDTRPVIRPRRAPAATSGGLGLGFLAIGAAAAAGIALFISRR